MYTRIYIHVCILKAVYLEKCCVPCATHVHTHLISLRMELEVMSFKCVWFFFFIAFWVFLQVWEIQGVQRVWRMLDFFQGLRGEDLLADTIVWFLCDGLLGYGCYVYRNTSGKTLVAVIRFLQKYLERVWWVCLCYTQMEEGTFFLFSLC